jgi:hypothetical protein
MISLSIDISEDQKDKIVVETLIKDYFTLSEYAEDLRVKDAIATILSSYYMTEKEFEKVLAEREAENTEKKSNKEKDKKSSYYIDPLQGYKWGFPKPISQENILGNTMKWLTDNGYPKEIMDGFGKHFKFTIWSEKPTEDQK